MLKEGQTVGITPTFTTNLYDSTGNKLDLNNSYDTVRIGVTVKNKDKLDSYTIEVKDSSGNKINEESNKIANEDKSYSVPGIGTYTVIVKVTKDGREKTNQRTIVLKGKGQLNTNVEITPNGGDKYVMPTTGKAKLTAQINEKLGNNSYKYSYGWSTSPTAQPSSWINTQSKATIIYPEITGLTKQNSFDNVSWKTYVGPVTIEKNETIYARSIDSTSQGSDSTRVASLTVSNIEKNSPIVAFGTNGSTEYKKEQSTSSITSCR